MNLGKNSTTDDILLGDHILPKIQSIAVRAHQLGLALPVKLLLEMHRPLRGISSVTLDAFAPFVSLILSKQLLDDLKLIMSDEQAWEKLLVMLEPKGSHG